jgi:hypothetical protein
MLLTGPQLRQLGMRLLQSDLMAEQSYKAMEVYHSPEPANILFAAELAKKRLEGTGGL